RVEIAEPREAEILHCVGVDGLERAETLLGVIAPVGQALASVLGVIHCEQARLIDVGVLRRGRCRLLALTLVAASRGQQRDAAHGTDQKSSHFSRHPESRLSSCRHCFALAAGIVSRARWRM